MTGTGIVLHTFDGATDEELNVYEGQEVSGDFSCLGCKDCNLLS